MATIRGQCSICMTRFLTGNFAALPCGHTYHFDCVAVWVKKSQTCPVCRAKCQVRQIIKQVFFEQGLDDTIASQDQDVSEDLLKAKVEELSINLNLANEEAQSARSDLAQAKHSKEVLEAKLTTLVDKYKKRIPALESKCRSYEMMMDDQEAIKIELDKAKARLKVTDFYKLLSARNAIEEVEKAVDKYVSRHGDPDTGKFLIMIRKQLEESRRSEKKANDERNAADKRSQKLEKEKAALQKLVQDLTQECRNLRDEAQLSTPINKKLRIVLDKSPPRRTSFDFAMNLSGDFDKTVDESILNSAFRRKNIPGPTLVPVLKVERKVTWTEEKRKWEQEQSADTSSSSTTTDLIKNAPIAFPSLNDTADGDDSFFDKIEIPVNVMKRVKSGSPKKKTSATGGSVRPSDRALMNLEHGIGAESPILAPRLLKPAMKRAAKLRDYAPPPKTGRLSTYFKRSGKENNTLITLD